jgi:ribose transport system ATP-binding protein
MTSHAPEQPVLTLEDITKSYGGNRALDGVSLSVRGGRVHAIVGENGAGKSTLVKVMTGIVESDSGTIRLDGQPVHMTARDAGARGVHIVHQELALFDELSVAQNLFIGNEPTRMGLLDRRARRRRAAAALERLGAPIDPDTRVGSLSTASKQLVEIARGLVQDARLLVLDEPTAALPPEHAEGLFSVIRSLAADGEAIVYISHRLQEVLDLADEVTVLKDGRHVVTRAAAGLDVDRLAGLMVGRDITRLYPPKRSVPSGEPAIRVRGLVDPPKLVDVDLDVAQGEIVGVYGLEGTGQDELLACLAGDRKPVSGTLELNGRAERWRSVPAVLRRNVGLVPQDRKQEGLLLEQSSVSNAAFSILRGLSRAGFVSRPLERRAALAATKAATVAGDVDAPVAALSGGNQQKVSLARLIAADCKILLLNQPTRGVDVGSKEEIYSLVRRLCEERGAAALVASPELSELLGLCDRVLVLIGGRIVGEAPQDATEEDLLAMTVAR